jgi:TolB protein
MSPTGADLRLLLEFLNPGALASAPAWSPDGKYLLFATQRDGNLELYQLTLDGGELKRLTHNTTDDNDPDW